MFLFLFSTTLLIPITMLVVGIFWRRHAPKSINSIYGFRTAMSMKNQETWDFAHACCSRVWLICGLWILPLTVIAMYLCRSNFVTASLWILGVQLAILVCSVIPTCRALNRRFDREGRRKPDAIH
jgi:uncharacterized membrane protein